MLALIPLALLFATAACASDVVLLAGGKSMTSGNISPSLKWQSSGKTLKCGCPKSVNIAGQCFTFNLVAKGELQRRYHSSYDALSPVLTSATMDEGVETLATLFEEEEEEEEEKAIEEALAGDYFGFDEQEIVLEGEDEERGEMGGLTKRATARQRIEILSWPPASFGSVHLYTWDYRLGSVSTSNHLIHLGKVIRRSGAGGPAVTLNALNGKISFDGLKGFSSTSVPLSRFVNQTTRHIVKVKYGAKGSVDWVVRDLATSKTVMSYHAKGNVGTGGSAKFGLYLSVNSGMKAAKAYAGNYSHRQL